MKVIIYKQDNGVPAIVCPAQEALARFGLMAIALKDVPAGKKFKIMDASEIPNIPQEEWVIDDSELNDGVGSESNEFQ